MATIDAYAYKVGVRRHAETGTSLPGRFSPADDRTMSPTTTSTLDMIRACFRHQHPEDFGRAMVDEGPIPPELRYGTDHVHPVGRIVPEEAMGDPDSLSA